MSKFNYLFVSTMFVLLFSLGCSKEDIPDDVDVNKGYIYAFAPGRGAGHLVYSKELLKGDFGAEKVRGIEFKNAGMLGVMRGKAYYSGQNNLAKKGVYKVGIDKDGGISEQGFINVSSYSGWGTVPVEVVGDKGFYFDHSLKTNAVQTFNPKTMARTGEIVAPIAELNKLKNASTQYIYLENVLIARDGKLFAQVSFKKDVLDKKTGKPTGRKVSAVKDKIVLAVFDINTNSFEKLISANVGTDGVMAYGYANSRLAHIDEAGDLWFGTLSDDTFVASGVILRIKKGQTEFDTTVNLKVRDQLSPRGADFPIIMSFCSIGSNKLLLRVFPESPHIGGAWKNWGKQKMKIWKVDAVTKTKESVLNIPGSVASAGSIVGLVRLDGKVYIPVTYQTAGKTTKTEQYSYDIKTGKIEKVFTVKGYNYHEFVKLGTTKQH